MSNKLEINMPRCDFGCKRPAVHTFKNGKYCCSKAASTCPAMKQKNSASKAGINPWEGREHPKGMLGKRPWNAGLNATQDKRVARAAKKLSKTLTGRAGHKHTEESKRRISESMKAVGAGGYREGSGRGKKGWYNGIWCDSSWELAFVLWCGLNDRKVKRAKKKFTYKYEGRNRKYLPDFRYQDPDGKWKYVEIKGYVSEQWKAKKKAFPHDLLFISHKAMNRVIFPQVHSVFGTNIVSLYTESQSDGWRRNRS